ncbi:magnesium transporter [Lentzea sp. NPDC042327]|uniref:magnesium transporter n=1 Tax=Lentzea sp. NPDC042327 TaxID=3154801 RepID=UPI0033D00B02
MNPSLSGTADPNQPVTGRGPADLLSTAAAHASMNVPVVAATDIADEVHAGLRGRKFDSAAVLAVCRGDALIGLVTIEQLLAASPDTPMSAIMDARPPVVHPHVDQEKAARQAVQNREPGLAVITPDGRFRGLISAQRLLGVLIEEHDEDLARLGGFLTTSASARSASTERVARRLWHRLPWLLVGLAGALLAAGIVGSFEELLARQVLVALFVPGVVYIADAVGTQTAALVIRGLSVGIGIGRVALREVVTGVLLGTLLAAIAFPPILLVWGDFQVALAVSAALLVASSIATAIAMALPWLLHRLGRDPAFGSGPLATVVQDLLSVYVYFVIATALL